MNSRIEIDADGADVRDVAGEISGTPAERKRQLRDLFRLAAAAVRAISLNRDWVAVWETDPLRAAA